eukprot:277939-Pyramimonas_sp.AAC.1
MDRKWAEQRLEIGLRRMNAFRAKRVARLRVSAYHKYTFFFCAASTTFCNTSGMRLKTSSSLRADF